MTELTFDELTEVNTKRANRWHEGFGLRTDDWTGSDWSNAMGGEAGEAQNVVKKLRRAETKHKGNLDPDVLDLVVMLGDEIADTIIYLDLLATYYGVDIPTAIRRKFNAVSDREGFPEKL